MSTENPVPPAPAAPAPAAPKRSFLADRRAGLQRLNMTPPTWDPVPDTRPKNPKKYYSAERRGFFTEEIHGDNLPADAVEITTEEWSQLIHEQSAHGKQIVPGPGGKPIAVTQVVTPDMKRQLIEAQIDAIRRAPDTLDLARAAALDKPGAKEQLSAIDKQIEALRATIPPQ